MKYKIVVSKGVFSSVFDAAFGEKNVDWTIRFGGTECIECFLATDFKKVMESVKNDVVQISDTEEFSFENETSDVIIFIGNKTSAKFSKEYGISYQLPELPLGTAYLRGMKFLNKHIVFLSGCDDEGTRNAVMLYMERLGINFIFPGEKGIYYNENKDYKTEAEFEITKEPSYKTRGAYSSFVNTSDVDFLMWLFHNKINYIHLKNIGSPELLKKLCFYISVGGHDTFYKYMDVNHEYPYCHKIFGGKGKPDDPYPVSPLFDARSINSGVPLTYGKAHPEWFAEVDGKRRCIRNYEEAKRLSHYTGDYICTSNEDATDEVIRLIVDSLAFGELKYTDYFNLWPMDSGTWCSCEKCSQDKVLSYRQLMLAYKLDKSIKKAREEGKIKREIKIVVPAYRDILEAPDKPLPYDFDYNTIFVILFVNERCYMHDIDDPVCKETNQMLIDVMKPWINGFYKGELMIAEYYNAAEFSNMPFIFTKRMANDILYYHKNGARHIYYRDFVSKNWGVFAINNYLYSKILWDADVNCDDVLHDYFYSRYGKYKDEIKEIYSALEKATASCKYWKHYQCIGKKRRSLNLDIIRESDDLMNCNHIHLFDKASSCEAGLSFAQIKDEYERIYDKFIQIYENADDKSAFETDFEQIEYGLNTIGFLYYMACYIDEYNWEIKTQMFGYIDDYAKKLENTFIPLEGYKDNCLFQNGLAASRLKDCYEKFKAEIEGINANNIIKSKTHKCPTIADFYRLSNEYNMKDRGVKIPHWHNEYEFLLFVDGEATQVVNSKCYKVKKGDLTFLSPADYHLFLYDKDESISYKLLRFKSAFYNKYLKGVFEIDELPYIISLSDKTFEKLIEVFDIFSCEYKKTNTDKTNLMCIKSIVEILALMLKEKDKNIAKSDGDEPVKAAMTYIQKNFKNDISVKDIANEVNYSQNYLSVLFIKTLGVSCKNYLMDVRLDYAYNLIMHSDITMKAACFESGFNSLSYFSNAFKTKYGNSPKQLVDEIKQKQKRNNLRGDVN